MHKAAFFALAILLSAACGDDDGNGNGGDTPDATTGQPDGSTDRDAATTADAAPEVDANLSDHGFVEVDGTLIVFEETATYTNDALGDVTINGTIGPDCPIGADCTTLYVTVPGDAALGHHSCDDLGVSVQLSEGSDRFFSFGSAGAFCGFELVAFDTDSGGQVAVTDLAAQLEADNDPGNRRLLSGGELRATTF